ncbi:hypothetical protein ACFLYQ_07090 [Chloroflexota bacterium]
MNIHPDIVYAIKHLRESASLCYNVPMRLPSSRIGWAIIPGALVLALSGLAVAAQSGLFSGALEDEAREYAIVIWGVAGALIVSGAAIILLNIIKKRRSG